MKFSFERAVAQGSVNKDKAVFNNIVNIATTDDLTVVLTLKNPNPDFLFQLGPNHGVDRRAQERGHQQHAAGGHRAVPAGELEQGQLRRRWRAGMAIATPGR